MILYFLPYVIVGAFLGVAFELIYFTIKALFEHETPQKILRTILRPFRNSFLCEMLTYIEARICEFKLDILAIKAQRQLWRQRRR